MTETATETPPIDGAADVLSAAPETTTEAPEKDVLDKQPDTDASSQPAGDVLSDDGVSKSEGVPDSYTFEAPEGTDVSEEQLDAYKAIAKDSGLTQTQFDALAKFDMERTQAADNAAVDVWNERVKGWREAAFTDKEFGGAEYQSNVTQALKLVDKFGDDDLKAILKSPSEDNPEGLAIGNNPAVLRFLHRIGKQVLGEPELVQGDASTQTTTDEERLRRIYPSMFN